MELLKKIWHLVPYNIRTKILVGSHLKRNIAESKEKIELIDKEYKDTCEEIRNSIDYMISHNRIAAFNAEWTEKYLKMPIKIKRDNGWPYYEYYGKRMYLKKNWNNDKACAYVKNILMEQDTKSPHRYFEENEILENEVVFDCGGAEGNFVLEIIDKIDKAVIFECDEEWLEALKRTFEPFKEKVIIVDKFVGNGMEGTVSLDSIAEQFQLYPSIIKMDIEGAEVDALDGIAEIIHKSSDLKLYVCTYHRADDENVIISKLSNEFEIQQSKGYMFYKNSFRKALVRATLKEN